MKEFFKIYNKVQRLNTAIFLVIKTFDGEEDIKTRIRTLTLGIMSVCVSLKDANSEHKEESLKDLERKTLELVSLLDIAGTTGMISEMNGAILKSELQSFLDDMSAFHSHFESDRTDAVKTLLKSDQAVNQPMKPTPLIIGSTKEMGVEIKDIHKAHKRRDMRSDLIIDFITKHPDVGIKEITPNIRGCSEKTVQRELISLIQKGKIKKVGERRWSKYSVA